jgi:hypothetical protein
MRSSHVCPKCNHPEVLFVPRLGQPAIDDRDRVEGHGQGGKVPVLDPSRLRRVVAGSRAPLSAGNGSDRREQVLVDGVEEPFAGDVHDAEPADDASVQRGLLVYLAHDGLLDRLARLYPTAR